MAMKQDVALAMPEKFIPARIEGIAQVTPLIKVFTLVTDAERFRTQAGQWLDLAIPRAGEPVVGGYSVVSAPCSDGRLELAIKYADRHPATHHLHTASRVGDQVYITPGQGSFFFDRGMGSRVVLLGAGIGVTPLVSILRHIRARMPEVRAHLLYSVASRQEVLFADELAAMSTTPNIEVTLTVTGESEDWRGHTGRISHRLLESLALPRDALFYFCGSRGFIDDMQSMLRDWGIPERQLKYEKWW